MTTQEEIRELAKHNSVVHMAVNMWERDFVSWEEAMMMAVKVLAKQNEILQQSMTQILANSTSVRLEGNHD